MQVRGRQIVSLCHEQTALNGPQRDRVCSAPALDLSAAPVTRAHVLRTHFMSPEWKKERTPCECIANSQHYATFRINQHTIYLSICYWLQTLTSIVLRRKECEWCRSTWTRPRITAAEMELRDWTLSLAKAAAVSRRGLHLVLSLTCESSESVPVTNRKFHIIDLIYLVMWVFRFWYSPK